MNGKSLKKKNTIKYTIFQKFKSTNKKELQIHKIKNGKSKEHMLKWFYKLSEITKCEPI